MTGKIGYKLDIVYWHKLSNPADSVPMRFYYNAGENPATCKALINPLCTYFSQHFCEHPFEKNGFATLNSDFTWGGMENQTLTSLAQNYWSTQIIVHEFAHQWFGDLITCATWADIWLNEGFATWSEQYWKENTTGYAAYKSGILFNADAYFYANPGWAISDPDWAVNTPPANVLFNYQVTYAKGSCVVHMLRYVLGDSLFFATLQAYFADTSLRFRSATIDDFSDVVSAVSGQNLDWFFNEWIYYPNHPVYQNQYALESLPDGTWDVNLLLAQVQTNAPFFAMPAEVKVFMPTLPDTVITVMNNQNNQFFSWNFPEEPDSIQFDPRKEIVLKKGTTIRAVDGRTWTGAVSSDWKHNGNWNPAGIPGIESVRIPAAAAHMPVIVDQGMTCGALTIEDGASLTVNPGKILTVYGRLSIGGVKSMSGEPRIIEKIPEK
jgi:aminopeptidase N